MKAKKSGFTALVAVCLIVAVGFCSINAQDATRDTSGGLKVTSADDPSAADSTATPFRKWVSRDGKYTIEARLISRGSDHVVLERKDGKRITVPLSQLAGFEGDDGTNATGPSRKPARDSANVPKRETSSPRTGDTESREKPVYSSTEVKTQGSTKLPVVDGATCVPQLGHAAGINQAVFSPDEKYILTASVDRTLILWNAATGRQIRTFIGHSGPVHSVAFRPEGKSFVSGGGGYYQGEAIHWDVTTGSRLRVFRRGTCAVRAVTIDPSGDRFVTGFRDGAAAIWNLDTGELIRELVGHSGSVNVAAFSPDGSKVLTAGGPVKSGKAILWNSASGAKLARVYSIKSIHAVAFSQDSKHFFAPGFPGDVCRYSANTGEREKSYEVHHSLRHRRSHTDFIRSIAISRDGRRVGYCEGSAMMTFDPTAGKDGTNVLQFTSGKQKEATAFVPASASDVTSIQFSRDGTRILLGLANGAAGIWNTKHDDTKEGWWDRGLMPRRDQVKLAKFSSDNRRIFACDDLVYTWDPAAADVVSPPEFYASRTRDRGFHTWRFQNNEAGIVGINYQGLQCSKLPSGELEYKLPGAFTAAAFTHDDGRLLTVDGDGEFVLWDTSKRVTIRNPRGSGNARFTKSLEKVRSFSTEIGRAECVVFNDDSSRILAGFQGGKGVLLDSATGDAVFQLDGHAAAINSVAFSPDGSRAVTASSDKTVLVWNVTNGTNVHTLRGHTQGVRDAMFSPDGTQILTAGDDTNAILWDAKTGERLHTLTGHVDSITSVDFRNDGRLALTSSNDGTIQLWDPVTGAPVARLTWVFEGNWHPFLNVGVMTSREKDDRGWMKPPRRGESTLHWRIMWMYDWLVITPDGKLDGSSKAFERLRWRVGDELLPAETHLKQVHRPGLLKGILHND